MNWPPKNEIIIDTNVFRHMCDRDPNFNGDGHCVVLLGNLASQICVLLVDSAGYFYHEWGQIVERQFKRESEIGGEIAVLRYWADRQYHDVRDVSKTDDLAKAIKAVIHENEPADRAFVYLAFSNGRVLVTNDLEHIVQWPRDRPEKKLRRDRLFKEAKKLVQPEAEILLSHEANARMEASNA